MENPEKVLTDLNIKIGKAEQGKQKQDIDFLTEIISENLVFCRADGVVVRKEDYIKQLPKTNWKSMNTEIKSITFVENEKAVVVAIVTASGTRDDKPIGGEFRNVRLWKYEPDNKWRLNEWYNCKLS